MKKVTLLIFLVILMALNVLILYKYKEVQHKLSTIANIHKEGLTNKEKQLADTEKLYENNIIATKENENLKLNKELKLITIEGDTIFAKDAFKNNNLILRYSVLNCGDCVDAEFKNLERFARKFTNRITIITYHERIRGLIMDYKKLQELGLDNVTVYMLPNNQLSVPLEKHNIPYYFHITPDLTIHNVFIPLKEQPKLSEYYLKYSFMNFFEGS